MRIGLIGGTGKEGRGLAVRWAKAGHHVVLGSRDAERAKARAEEIAKETGGTLSGGTNEQACSEAEVVLLSVPYAAHGDTLRALKGSLGGRILIDITVPLRPPRVSEVQLPEGEAAALEAQAILGAETPVVAGLHHVSSVHLADAAHTIDCDVLLCGDDAKAKETVMGLVRDLGLFPVDAGVLRNSVALESLTPVLLAINRKYKIPGAGLRITGIPR